MHVALASASVPTCLLLHSVLLPHLCRPALCPASFFPPHSGLRSPVSTFPPTPPSACAVSHAPPYRRSAHPLTAPLAALRLPASFRAFPPQQRAPPPSRRRIGRLMPQRRRSAAFSTASRSCMGPSRAHRHRLAVLAALPCPRGQGPPPRRHYPPSRRCHARQCLCAPVIALMRPSPSPSVTRRDAPLHPHPPHRHRPPSRALTRLRAAAPRPLALPPCAP
ncbi:hypothetical protein DENSPDRAFT_886624 [Dentipellis sp. KUC8613]|nr:hypothetical protein DENSPDRAFT_886624 [Dentipellis sp. KUC8613]